MVGTTHDPGRGGRPRLVFVLGSTPVLGRADAPDLRDVELNPVGTSIGSGDTCGLRLPKIDVLQATIARDDADEYIFSVKSTTVPSSVNGQVLDRHRLRTGDRIEMGPWTLTFVRDENADHGRPHGGRAGGEGEHQRAQPPRSEVSGARDPASEPSEEAVSHIERTT